MARRRRDPGVLVLGIERLRLRRAVTEERIGLARDPEVPVRADVPTVDVDCEVTRTSTAGSANAADRVTATGQLSIAPSLGAGAALSRRV